MPCALTTTLTVDHERVASQVEAIQPTSGASNLRAALLEARRLLSGEPGEVYLFSDEAGPRMVAEATSELVHLAKSESAVVPMGIVADPPRERGGDGGALRGWA